jgi:uncharacterized protein (TIGR02145 family)
LYRPTQVLKGTTRNANNTGFYRFYCVATDASGVELTSDVAEVAVGCGAKTKDGKWLSFMCFNLGARIDATIAFQKSHSITAANTGGTHTYVAGEEESYGDLFQWGRIADGHEKRTSLPEPFGILSSSDIASGGKCFATDSYYRPGNQIMQNTSWDGKFITAAPSTINYNWNPVTSQAQADALWRSGRNFDNDPCTHYRDNGTYLPFWHSGGTNNLDPVCDDASVANWRLPTQTEWSDLYRGGANFGSAADAEANTWHWNETINEARGYELRPDNVTTTLFLPTSGLRDPGSMATFYHQGAIGYYWSSTAIGASAYNLEFMSPDAIYTQVNPSGSTVYRSHALALRCIKN